MSHSACGERRIARPVRATALVGVTVRRRRRPRGRDQLGDGQPGVEDLGLERRNVRVVDQVVVDRGDRVLPQQLLVGNPRAEVADGGSHVAVEQLVPGPRERVGEIVGVLEESLRDLLVDRINDQREVRREHRRSVPLRRVVGVRHRALRLRVLGDPLVRTGRALRKLPLVREEVGEEAVVPPDRFVGPNAFQPAGDGVATLARPEAARPAEPLLLDACSLGLGTRVLVGVGCAVGLAERMTAGDERDRLLVVHRHPLERLTDVTGRRHRIRVAVRALRIDVDQAHLDRTQRIRQFPVTAVALVFEPHPLRTPVDVLLGRPHVLAAAAETERLEAHRLQGAVPGKDQQIGPRDLPAVLLLDRPDQPARLVEAHVVGPTVERGEALCSAAAATTSVCDAVRASGVPRHADEERSVVAEVGRPPVLRLGHQCIDVVRQGLEVEAVELRRVVEVLAHGIGLGVVLAKDPQVQAVGPPVLVRRDPNRLVCGVHHRARRG